MRFKVQQKLTSLLLVVAIVPLIIIGTAVYQSNKRTLTDVIGESFEIVSENMMVTIDQAIHGKLVDIQLLMATADLSNESVSIEDKIAILKDYLLQAGFFNELSISNQDGEIIGSTDRNILGVNIGGEEWFLEATEHFVGVSDFLISPYTGKPTMMMANLLVDEYGEAQGVVMAELAWPLIIELLEFGTSDMELILVNSDGQEIGHSKDGQKHILERSWSEVVGSFSKDDIGVESFDDDFLYAYTPSAGYLTYDSQGWGLLIRTPTSIAFAELWRTSILILLVTVVNIFLAVTIGLVASRIMIRPINALTKGVQDIQKGNWDQTIPVQSNDEIGFLASSFNKMTKTLKEREEQLVQSIKATREESKKHKTILENTQDAILLIEGQGNIAAANQGFIKIFGIDPDSLKGKSQKEFVEKLDKLVTGGNRMMRQLKNYGNKTPIGVFNFELELQAPLKGDIRVLVAPIGGGDKAKGCLWIFRDISEEKEIERKKFAFITVASHQMRTPITAVRWSAELLKNLGDGALTEEQEELVDDIQISIKKAADILTDLLHLQQIEQKAVKAKRTAVDFDLLLQKALNQMQSTAQVKNIHLEVEGAATNALIMFNEEDAYNAIINIIDNAIRYSQDGKLVIVKREISKTEDSVLLKVKDQGIGITIPEQEHLFSPFYRGAHNISIPTDGSGMGLFMTKQYMEGNEGKVWFESKEGKGTTFFLKFPLYKNHTDDSTESVDPPPPEQQ